MADGSWSLSQVEEAINYQGLVFKLKGASSNDRTVLFWLLVEDWKNTKGLRRWICYNTYAIISSSRGRHRLASSSHSADGLEKGSEGLGVHYKGSRWFFSGIMWEQKSVTPIDFTPVKSSGVYKQSAACY